MVIDNYHIYKHCLSWNGVTCEEKELSKKEVSQLLGTSRAWMLRNCYEWDCKDITNFWEIICDSCYTIEQHPTKVRNQIRRALRDCEIKRIGREKFIADNAFDVFVKSFGRYRNVTVELPTREQWEKSLKNDDAIEYWGVYERSEGSLIAYGINTINGKSVAYNTLKAIPELMNKHYPYYGLLFEMNQYYLGERGFSYVSDGWRSITEHSGIQPFLEKNFLFRKSYCKMKLYYKWWFGFIIKLLYPFRNVAYMPLIVRHMLKFEEINRKLC